MYRWMKGIGCRLCRYALVMSLFACCLSVVAENRALLIGVGEYQDPKISDLPGIVYDLGMMREMAQRFGFAESQIRVLQDEEASLAGVERAFDEWLLQGVGPDDRALIYFSGHGSQVPDRDGDEEDKSDEVLLLNDSRWVNKAEGEILEGGLLLDDRLNQLLGSIAARETLLIVDACQSGTSHKRLSRWKSVSKSSPVDKLLGSKSQIKFFAYRNMPASRGGASYLSKSGVSSTPQRYVSLAAARDNEYALATPRGSGFTLGLKQAVDEALSKGTAITPCDLLNQAQAYINSNFPSGLLFHPQTGGSQTLCKTALPLQRTMVGVRPQWQQLNAVYEQSRPFSMRLKRNALAVEEMFELEMELPSQGYLNVVTVGPDDRATVLFPNRFHPENRVEEGLFRLPDETMLFSIPAEPPRGNGLIVAFLSQSPFNLFEESTSSKALGGEELLFRQLSEFGAQNLKAIGERKTPLMAGRAEFNVY